MTLNVKRKECSILISVDALFIRRIYLVTYITNSLHNHHTRFITIIKRSVIIRLVSVQLDHIRTVSERLKHCHCDIGSLDIKNSVEKYLLPF